MPDVHDRETRSRNMAAVRAADTKPEMLIRQGVHARGFRYRLHVRRLPGKPDLVFPKYDAVFFVHGCFWHGHDCPLFRLPGTRTEFWTLKISGNIRRDRDSIRQLRAAGWRTGIVWECALRGRYRKEMAPLFDHLEDWLKGSKASLVIAGNEAGPQCSPLVAP